MLSEAQLAHLEHLVHSINVALHIEEATLNAQQTLTLVLCNETICFRPLHITAQEVDIAAALAGQPSGAWQKYAYNRTYGIIRAKNG